MWRLSLTIDRRRGYRCCWSDGGELVSRRVCCCWQMSREGRSCCNEWESIECCRDILPGRNSSRPSPSSWKMRGSARLSERLVRRWVRLHHDEIAAAVGAAFFLQTPLCGTTPALIEPYYSIGGDPILVILTEQVPDSHLAGLRKENISYIFAGKTAIVKQIVPHTFLRTRLFTHVYGDVAESRKAAAELIKHACELLQADRAEGRMAPGGRAALAALHKTLEEAYAGSS